MMNEIQFNNGLLDFLKCSPTPFHAVAWMADALEKAGFVRLDEAGIWNLQKSGRYYVTRNGSSLIAFTTGSGDIPGSGFRMTGAHTDSPCLKVKPNPEIISHTCFQLGVEVYGGALLNPWFDRDLSMAGRVTFLTNQDLIESRLVDFRAPVAVIPSLAIHFDREANRNRNINPQTELPPVLLLADEKNAPDFKMILLKQLQAEHPDCGVAEILDHEICFYDHQPSAFTGLNRDFISGARLDNLLSCYTGLMALLESGNRRPALLVCNDHEEIGSMSASGADGPFLSDVLERICPVPEDRIRAASRSMMVSADDAHAVHPNHAGKSDPGHKPLLNHGPVIKFNASQRYATGSETAAEFRRACRKAGVPVQEFVMRSDMACGSTIGPITASRTGIATVDVGVPIFAMHSVREMAGNLDSHYLYQALCQWYDQ